MADLKKVNSLYYPPDYDPSKLLPVRAIRPKRTAGARQLQIRMMLPFTMRCGHCDEFLFIATKFNSRCEKVQGTTQLGLNAYRFYGNCKHCKGEFVFRTDPEKSDYVLESGGVRSYEAFKDAELAEMQVAEAKAEGEATNEGQALENKIYDTAEEMRRIEELGELRSINKREARRNEAIHLAIDRVAKAAFDEAAPQELEDEEAVAEEFRNLKKQRQDGAVSSLTANARPTGTSSLSLGKLGIKIKPKTQ